MPVSRSRIAVNARLTSAVKIEDESPKLEALLMRIASSRLDVRLIASTAPEWWGRPPLVGGSEPVAELERRGPFRHAPHQLVVHLLVHDHAAARGAALPRRAGRAPPDRGGGGAQ